MRLGFFAVVALVLLLGLPAAAQVTTATIYGLVQDPSGGVVTNSTATATNELTGLAKSAPTNELGQFTITFLPVGRYTIMIETPGFKTYRESGIELTAGQKANMVFSLEVGAVTESVEVTAERPLVNASSAQQNFSISTTEIRELPLLRRDFTNLLNLGTGVTQRPGFGGNSVVVVNGLPPASFGFTIDGTDSNQDPFDGSMGLYQNFQIVKGVSIESVQEVQIAKDIYSAEIAGTMSGNVNLITRGGTNEFHGSAFENYQAGGLNARNQFLVRKAPLILHQFGGSLGGPIRRNRLFFFGTYEGYRLTSQQALNGNVPTAEFRARAIAAVPAYERFLNLFPLPTFAAQPGAISGFFQGTGAFQQKDNHGVARVDWNLTPGNLLTVRYTRFRPFQIVPNIAPENFRDWVGMIESGNINFTHGAPGWSAETRFGFNKNDFNRRDGIYLDRIPCANLSGQFSTCGEIGGYGGDTSSIEQVLAWTRGRHSLKLGGILKFVRIIHNGGEEMPSYSYLTADQYLANTPNSITFTFAGLPFHFNWWEIGGFLQDDIRLTPRLTVNLGLRYDYYAVPTATDGRIFNRDGPFGPLRPPDNAYNADFNNFSPRAGLAWKLDSLGKTVLRTGFGMFHSVHRHRAGLGVPGILLNDLQTPGRVTFSRAELMERGIRYPADNPDVLPLVRSQALTTSAVVNPNFPNPYSLQWTFGLQRQLTGSLAAEASYTGNHGVKLMMHRTFNRVDRITGQRPNPAFATSILYVDNSESSSYNSLQLALRKRFARGLSFNTYYTWSKVLSFGGADISLADSTSQELDNLALERAPAPHDIKHRFVSDFLYDLSLGRLTGSTSAASRLLLQGWQVGGILIAETGPPLNVSQVSADRPARPDFAGANYGSAILPNAEATLQYLDRNAFSPIARVPASGATARAGNLGRNAFRAPGAWNLDLSLAKNLLFTERYRLQLRVDMLNAFNHTNFTGVVANLDSPNFGRFTSTRGARQTQFNLRFLF